MPNLGPTELIIIGVVLVLLFGATRLPQTAKGLGQALKIFKKEIRDEDKPAAEVPPAQTSSEQASAPAAQAAPVSQANGAAPQPKDAETTK